MQLRNSSEAMARGAWGLALFGATGAAATAQGLSKTLGQTQIGPHQILLALGALVLLVILIFGSMAAYYALRRGPDMEGVYLEPAVLGSRFEQLLAEIQGLTLRVQGGESKGYYRKIEQLVRVFLERIGYKDARHMENAEIQKLLASGEIQQEIAAALRSIFDRCKQGAIHETEKLDFNATDLLKDLRIIIKRVEKTPARS